MAEAQAACLVLTVHCSRCEHTAQIGVAREDARYFCQATDYPPGFPTFVMAFPPCAAPEGWRLDEQGLVVCACHPAEGA